LTVTSEYDKEKDAAAAAVTTTVTTTTTTFTCFMVFKIGHAVA
jgi:hypothetical protein